MTAIFVADARQFMPTFTAYQRSTVMRAEIQWLEGRYRGNVPAGLVPLPNPGGQPDMVFIDAAPIGSRQASVMAALGCSVIDDGSPVIGANDRDTFAFWLKACQSRRIGVAGNRFYLLYSTRAVAEQAYRDVLFKLIELIPVLLAAFALQIFMLNSLERSLRGWSSIVKRFGQPNLEAPTASTLREFVKPVANFVKANNDYVALVTERRRLGEALTDLSRGIDLRLLSNVRFEAASGLLSFVQIDLDAGSVPRAFTVHVGDRLALVSADHEEQAIVELRIPGAAPDDWHLLMARELLAPGHWQSGCIIRLHQPKVTQNRMLHQARLIELGGMASALSHELKQPLFTIALAAENGTFQLADDDRPGTAKALAKFSRIIDQVERARTIIGRISRYARVDSADELFDLIDGVQAAMIFMRPLLVQEDVHVELVNEMGDFVTVRMPRVGLEQILVNAVQNAVDSIVTRRQSHAEPHFGAITIRCARTASGVTIEITDNGTGLNEIAAEKLFEAFITTKSVEKGTGLGLYISRQIMMEAGGTIDLASRPAPDIGAVMTINFNAIVPADARAEAA